MRLFKSAREAYLQCANDDERTGFLEAMIESLDESPDGALCAMMEEAIGEDWLAELERLGLAGPPAETGGDDA